MTITVKKRKSILTILTVALLLIVVGLFGLFAARPKKTVAHAAESTSSEFYFNAGAAAGLDGWNLYTLKFRLWVQADVFADDDYVVFYITEGASESQFAESEKDDLAVLKSEFKKSGDLLYYDVKVSSNLNTTVQLLAGYYDTSESKAPYTAYSDERNILTVWKAFADNGYVMASGKVLSEDSIIRQVIDQALETHSAEVNVAVGEKVMLGDYKLQLQLYLSPTVTERFSQGEIEIDRPDDNPLMYDHFYEYLVLHIYRKSTMGEAEEVGSYTWNQLPEDIQEDGFGIIYFPTAISGAGDTTEYQYYAEIRAVTTASYTLIFWEFDERYQVGDEVWNGCVSNSTDAFSERGLAQELLEREDIYLNTFDKNWLLQVAGVSTETAQLLVSVYYKRSADDGYTVTDGSFSFMALKTSFFRLGGVTSAMHALTDFQSVSDFNVIGAYSYYEDENGYDFYFETEKKIVLTADHYEYEVIYEDDVPVRGELTVVYKPYNYKDLAIRVTTLDVNKRDRYTLDYYTSRAVDDGNAITLTYRYAEIQNNLLNGLGWIFTPSAENISYTLPAGSGITVDKTETELVVTCPKGEEERLIDLDMRLLADIESDYACTVTYKYAVLTQDGFEISERIAESEEIDFRYSELIQLNYYNFNQRFGSVVSAGCQPTFLQGVQHYKPVDIRKVEKSRETHTDEDGNVIVDSAVYELVVEYEYETIFAIYNNFDDSVRYVDLNDVSVLYYGTDVVEEIPDGYRVKSITSTSDGVRITTATNASDDYTKTKLQVLIGTKEKEVLPVCVEYTDKWHIVIEYLAEYADLRIRTGQSTKPAFAKAERFEGEIKVKDYADIYALSDSDVQAILGVDKLTIMGLSNVEKITVSFDNVATYTVKLDYTYAALKAINYDGDATEIKIPLSSYADWVEGMGQDWSILWLNKPDRKYFQYANDVESKDLYGFFSVAVFDHRVSDLNYWFKETDGDGFVSVYESTEVQGSKLYQTLYGIREKLAVAPLTTIAMGVSELINDDNKMVHSHFFYLDGTTNMSYLGENDPDDYDDTDGALDNKVDDAVEGIKDFFDDLGNSPFVRILKVILGAGVLVLFAVIVIGIIKKTRDSFNNKK